MGSGSQGAQSSPVQEPNTLRSTSFAKVLFLLGKGQIKRWVGNQLANALRIDGVPLLSPNGAQNFKGWNTWFREGLPSQDYVPGLETNSQVIQVNERVRKDLDVVRTINDPDIDAVDVVIRLPALLKVEDDNDVVGTSVSYTIEIQPAGESYETKVSQTLEGKTDSPYQRSHHIVLNGSAPWNIRVHRVTDDSEDENQLRNLLQWEYYALVEYDKRAYNGYALVGLHIDTAQLDSLGDVTVEVLGSLILTPHNYDGEAHSYSGLFDGSLIRQWSNNPVWVLLDILLTRVPLSSIRLYEFYSAAQYCDEVIDGEPRFTFNHVFSDRRSTFATARDVAGTFNGRLVPRGTKIGLVVDRPNDPDVTPWRNFDVDEMVGRPDYLVSSSLEVGTVTTVTYREPEQDYNEVSFVVRDEPGIKRFGEREVNLKALGCTSRNQAARSALWTMATPRLNPVQVKFTLPLSGRLVQVGDVFTITDPRRDSRKQSGRIVDFEATNQGDRFILDAEYAFTPGLAYNLCLTGGENGALLSYEVNTELTGVNASVVVTRLDNRVPVEHQPSAGDIWLIKPSASTTIGFAYTATKIAPVEGKPNHYTVEGVLYDPDKFVYIDSLGKEKAGNYQARTNASVLELPSTPFNVRSRDIYQYNNAGEVVQAVVVSWSYSLEDIAQLDYFEIEKRPLNSNTFEPVGTSRGRSYTVENAIAAGYEFRVAAISRIGRRSDWASTTSDRGAITFVEGAPSPVSNLVLSKIDNTTIHLKWDASTNPAVRRGGFFRVRHTPKLVDPAWDSGTLVARLNGDSDEVTLPFQEGTYMVRTYSSQETPSVIPSLAATTYTATTARSLLFAMSESPNFAGRKEQTKTVNSKLRLGNQEVWNTIPAPFNALPAPVSAWGASAADAAFTDKGYYYFDNEFQVAQPTSFYLYPVVDVAIVRQDEIWNNLSAPFNELPASAFRRAADIDRNEDYGETPYAKIEISLSSDNGATYSEWQRLIPGEFYGTNVRARLEMKSDRPALSNEVSTLELLVFG